MEHATHSASSGHHKRANHTRHHPTQSTRTLMRQAVRKPVTSARNGWRVVTAAEPSNPLMTFAEIKSSVQQLDSHRLRRAQSVKKSTMVTHFTKAQPAMPSAMPITTQFVPERAHIPVHHSSPKRPPTTEEFLQRALDRANSHEQPPVKRSRRPLAFLHRAHG